MRIGILSVLAALASNSVPALGATDSLQVAPASESASPTSEIVVTGRTKAVFAHFVEALTQAGPSDQIARWRDEVCPLVIGIEPRQADSMVRRIGGVAKSLKLRLGGSGCTSTLAIIITPNARATAGELLRRYPVKLGTDGLSRLKAFVSSTDPVRWISVTDECGGHPGGICTLPNSRLAKATRPTFSVMIVIVDANRLDGFSLGELSDYIALVALSNPSITSSERDDSILSMFVRQRTENAPFTLTASDHSFLAGLYNAPLDSRADGQRTSITTRMKRDAEKQRQPTPDTQK